MPNGVRRQRNTRHANRQRNLERASQVQAEPVEDAPVVQAEVVEGRLYTGYEMADLFHKAHKELTSRYCELNKAHNILLDRYEKAKSGTLLGFQEVEIEDLEQENFELKSKLGEAEEKVDLLLRESEDELIENRTDAVEQFIKRIFVKTRQEAMPSVIQVGGHEYTLIPHNCPHLPKSYTEAS